MLLVISKGKKMISEYQDAFGHILWDCLEGKASLEIVEKTNGFIGVGSLGPKSYFALYKNWPFLQKKAIRYARGRVLDIGCGAGKHSLYLQGRGFDVLGIDTSPLALKVCRERGLKKTKLLSITQINSKLGKFNTLLMLGNNFGLFGNPKRARWLLRRFHKITHQEARIIAETRDPYNTTEPFHLKYHELNRKRGRMPGQLRIRIRYKRYATPWFDYLCVSSDEMRNILKDTGWRINSLLDSDGPLYIAIIEKD